MLLLPGFIRIKAAHRLSFETHSPHPGENVFQSVITCPAPLLILERHRLGYLVIKKGGKRKRHKDLDTCRISSFLPDGKHNSTHINNIDAGPLHYQIFPLLV